MTTENTTATEGVKESDPAMIDIMHAARNLIKKTGGASEKQCTVCGKPESRNHKALNEGTMHGKCATDKVMHKLAMLEKALAIPATDLGMRTRFNAQVEQYKKELALARAEHDKYTPPEEGETNKAALMKVLSECLDLLRSPLEPRAEGWTVQQVSEALRDTIKRAVSQGQ